MNPKELVLALGVDEQGELNVSNSTITEVNGHPILTCHIVWYWHKGYVVNSTYDKLVHIDGDDSNNHISNLALKNHRSYSAWMRNFEPPHRDYMRK